MSRRNKKSPNRKSRKSLKDKMQKKKKIYDSEAECSKCGVKQTASEFPKLEIDEDFKITEAFCEKCYKEIMEDKLKKAKNFSTKHSFARNKDYKKDMLKLHSNKKENSNDISLVSCSQCDKIVATISGGQIHNKSKFEYYGDDELIYCEECLKKERGEEDG